MQNAGPSISSSYHVGSDPVESSLRLPIGTEQTCFCQALRQGSTPLTRKRAWIELNVFEAWELRLTVFHMIEHSGINQCVLIRDFGKYSCKRKDNLSQNIPSQLKN